MKRHNTPKNEMMGTTLRGAPTTPAEPAPTADERRAAAIAAKHAAQARNPEPASVARERLRTAKNEAFPRSGQYRPAQPGTGIVGSGEA